MPDTGSLVRKLRKMKARTILLQVPEGLKIRAQEMASELESSGFSVFISIEPCFGACDIRDREAKSLGCDVLVHVGHSDYGLRTALPVIYDEYGIDFDPVPLLTQNIEALAGFRIIGLASTVQYMGSLAKASAFLRKMGKKVLMGSGSVASHPGQVLGCDYSGPKSIEKSVDCFLFLGTGGFHTIGLAMAVEKPVFFLDFESGELANLDQERFNQEKIRFARIAKAAEARNFGILVSTKPGQSHPRVARQAKEKLESMGRKAWMFVADQVTPEKLLGLKVEALVNTACPRLIEDSSQFRKPIILPEDIDLFPED
jgi:2-(3-amino-3-carboxypropyl)histidine synthase